MTISTRKQFDFAKYIQKDLEDYNRLVVYFNNKPPKLKKLSTDEMKSLAYEIFNRNKSTRDANQKLFNNQVLTAAKTK